MNFFFDNTLSPKLARSVDQLLQPEHRLHHLKECFAPNAEDQQWMRDLAENTDGQWAIVTADVRVGPKRHELEAWKEADQTIFFLKAGWSDMTLWGQAQKFTKCFPDLIAAASKAARGTIFLVSVNGKVEALS